LKITVPIIAFGTLFMAQCSWCIT